MTKENIALVESLGEVVWYEGDERKIEPAKLRDALEGIDILLTGWGCCKLDEYVLEKADKLKLVAYTAGSVASLSDR